MAGYKKSKTQHSEDLTGSKGLDIDSGTLHVDDDNDKVGIGTASPKTKLTVEGTLTIKEQANAESDTAAYGQLWVKSDTPTSLYFTTDAGADIQITDGTTLAAGGSGTAVAADNINAGDSAVSIETTSGNITIDAQANNADVIIKVDDGGTSRTAVTFDGSENAIANFYADINVPGEVQTTGIGYTDGDNALTIADGGGVTAAAGFTSTAAGNTLGTTSFNDADITNVGDIALDTISSDGAAITVSSDLTCSQGIKINSGLLTAGGGATLDGAITLYGDITASQGIRVNNGPSILDGVINVYGDLTASQGIKINAGGLAVNDGTTTLSGDVTASQGIKSTDEANTFGATSFNDANITNVGDIALDTISSDGAAITVNSDLTCSQGIRVNMLTASDGATIDGVINLYGDVTASQGIRVNNGPSILDGVVNVYGDLTASQGMKINAGGLAVSDGTTTLAGDVTASQGFKISDGLLQTGGGANLDGVINLYGDVTASQGMKINAGGLAVNDGTTTLAGDVTASQGFKVSDGLLQTGGGANLDGVINLYGDVTASQGIKVNGGATLDGVVNVYGDLTASQGMTINEGTLTANGTVKIQGDLTASQGITVEDGVATFSGDFTASQGAVINSAAETVLQVSADSDKIAEIGKVHIGYDGASADVAIISHIDMNSNTNFALRQNASGETSINTAGSQALKLKISSANKIIMDANGQVGIGAAYSPSYKLDIKEDSASDYVANFFNDGDDANRYGIRIQAGADAGGGTTHYINCFDGDGGQVGHISNTSETFALTDASDSRLKDNIRDTAVGGLDVIDNIKVRDFEMKKNGISKTGFVAQELKEVYAPAVTGTEDDVEVYVVSEPTHDDETGEYSPKVTEERPKMMGVSSGILIPVLVKAVQELSSKVKELENKLGE